MAIYTRFGTPVTVVTVLSSQSLTVECRYPDGITQDRNVHISELKADGGLEEIERTMAALTEID